MMEKCNTYNTENLPPATSLAYFGIIKAQGNGVCHFACAYVMHASIL